MSTFVEILIRNYDMNEATRKKARMWERKLLKMDPYHTHLATDLSVHQIDISA
jgi:hypothetical protein